MRTSTSQFAEAIAGEHGFAGESSARVGTGGALAVLPVDSGSVTAARQKLIRQEVSLTVPGKDWVAVARTAGSRLSPFAGELVVKRGVRYLNGVVELLTIGVFVITSKRVDTREGRVALTGSDRMLRIIDDRFEAPRKPGSNPSTVQAIRLLIQETIPGITVTAAAGVVDRAYNGRAVYEESRAEAIKDMALSIGCEVFAANDGTFLIKKAPILGDPTVHTFMGTGPKSVVVNASDEETRDQVYNSVVVRSQPTDPNVTPINVVVRDNGATSPTKWGGNFGKKTRYYTSPLITSTAQALDAGKAILSKSIGSRATVDFAAVPDPRVEVGDVVNIDYGTSMNQHIIETLSLPIVNAGDLTADTRSAVATGDFT